MCAEFPPAARVRAVGCGAAHRGRHRRHWGSCEELMGGSGSALMVLGRGEWGKSVRGGGARRTGESPKQDRASNLAPRRRPPAADRTAAGASLQSELAGFHIHAV